MNRLYKTEIKCEFQLTENVLLKVKPYLEASFPCVNCKRAERTVVFSEIGAAGICTPRKKCSGFKGELKAFNVLDVDGSKVASYDIEYEYSIFKDLKRQKEAEPGSSWARVSYTIVCPKCGEEKEGSTQTNLVRPYRRICTCGNVLYNEPEDPIEIKNA